MSLLITWQKPTKKRERASKKKLEVRVNSIRARPFRMKELAKIYLAFRQQKIGVAINEPMNYENKATYRK